jgi:hypothetical protein
MSDAYPPKTYNTVDNIQWTFLQTFPDYQQMQEFRQRTKCQFIAGKENYWRTRFYCTVRGSHNCKFMLLALKTAKQRYHVYKNGKHNSHVLERSK